MITSIYFKIISVLMSIKYRLFGIKYPTIYSIESTKSHWSLRNTERTKDLIVLSYTPTDTSQKSIEINLRFEELEDLMNLIEKLKK